MVHVTDVKRYYKLKKDNKLAPLTIKLLKMVLEDDIAKTVTFTVDGITCLHDNLYFGVVDMNEEPVYGVQCKTIEEAFTKMISWVNENFELVFSDTFEFVEEKDKVDKGEK